MAKYKSRKKIISENRRKLISRWKQKDGQDVRSEIITSLREGKTLPQETAAAPAKEPDVFPGADLRCIDLSGQELDGIDLTGAKLQGANLACASLKKAKLVNADLRDALLRNTDLTDADLRGANLDGTIIENTLLQGADLTGAFVSDSTIVAGTTKLPSVVVRAKPSSWVPDHIVRSKLRRR